MKILLFGKTGQVGSEIFSLFNKEKIDVAAFPSNEVNIAEIKSLYQKKELFKSIDVVINTAAYTQVDKAEEEPEKAEAININGAKNLASVCKEFNLPLIQLSTDYVFSGNKNINFENDLIAPSAVYARSKAHGEQEISRLISDFIILRVSWVFGKNGTNFVKTMLRLAKEREEIKVVDDQIGCPTPATDIAKVLLNLIQSIPTNPHRGIYHYCGLEVVSWHEFALKIIEIARKYCPLKVKNVFPIKSHEYPSKVVRPQYSTLSCGKILSDFGIQQASWEPYLEKVIKEILEA